MSSPRTNKFKRVPSVGKSMLTQFWDLNAPILEHQEDRRRTVKSAQYCSMLENELKLFIRSKRRRILTNEGVLHRDHARPHTGTATVETIRKLKFQLLPQPAYEVWL